MMPYNTSTQGQYCHSCGMFHHHNQTCYYNNSNSGSYSMVFSKQNGGVFEQNGEDYYSSSVVDCTLSLGTPSTRLCEEDEKRRRSTSSGGSSCISNFWEMLNTKNKNNNSKTVPYNNVPSFSTAMKPARGGSGANGHGGGGGESLLARRCANCDTTSTPLWRNGPRGPKSLCNACGIRFKKEERRTTAATGNTVVGADQNGHHNTGGYHNYHNNASTWAHHAPQRVPCNYPANEIRFMDDYGGSNNGESDGGVPFLSWRLNVADRASLVQSFTR